MKENQEKHRRYKGKKVVVALVMTIGLIISAALFFWFRGREIRGPILSIAQVDSHRVLQLRRGFSQQKYVHLVMRDSAKGQLWSVALFGVQPGAKPLIIKNHVALRVLNAQGSPEMHAFDLNTGQFAWRAGLVDLPSATPLISSDRVEDDKVVLSYGGSIHHVFIIDPQSGSVLSERDQLENQNE